MSGRAERPNLAAQFPKDARDESRLEHVIEHVPRLSREGSLVELPIGSDPGQPPILAPERFGMRGEFVVDVSIALGGRPLELR